MKKPIAILALVLLSGCMLTEEPPDAPDGAARVPIFAVPCDGCVASDGTCAGGDTLNACGASGVACVACSFGETCNRGACYAAPSACVGMLSDAGFGDPCLADDECAADEWCAASCCDPVTHVCFAVGMCTAKRGHGEHCDYDNGDRQCLSGVCDPLADACL